MEDLLPIQLDPDFSSIIKVLGVGGGGSNAVNHMFRQGIKGVDFIVFNTDAQALKKSPVPNRVQLGAALTEGLGAGNNPDVGCNAAIESVDLIRAEIGTKTKMVFITAGMGGGTGTGAAPVIAKTAREMGILTVGIVTLPFAYEGKRRINQAANGIKELSQHVDALLIVSNEKVREMYSDFTISEAFGKADDVLSIAARGIAEMITQEGYVNVDFADVKTVMVNSGIALMGTGKASGEKRAELAVKEALSSPLLDNNDIKGAENVLINIVSGSGEPTMDEVGLINEYVQKAAGNDAELIWGTASNAELGEHLSVTVIATGFSKADISDLYLLEASQEGLTKEKTQQDKAPVAKEIRKPTQEKVGHPEKQTEIQIEYIPKTEKSPFENDKIVKSTTEGNKKTEYQTVEKQPETAFVAEDYMNNLDEYENEPAYKRRKDSPFYFEDMNNNKVMSKSYLSGYNNGQITISENNQFLHDKAD